MNTFTNSPKSFNAYPEIDFDLESGTSKRPRKPRSSRFYPFKMMKRLAHRLSYYYKLNPLLFVVISFSTGLTIFVFLSLYESQISNYIVSQRVESYEYPFTKLRNLVMVAGHSVYASSSCETADKEDAWFLESYQKHPGQAATFVAHIEKGVNIAANDDQALLLFSGGETRKDAGPRSEAQSYWSIAESKGWFGHENSVRSRALTEEHARDSFENLLFSVCRFRELTGSYPQNITVVGYDFKEERFAHLHRMAIGFPESRFYYFGTPASSSSKEGALKGEEMARSQFHEDPYGCRGSLWRKKLKRDPFHRAIPYPNGCPEIKDLFRYCGETLYPGPFPWS